MFVLFVVLELTISTLRMLNERIEQSFLNNLNNLYISFRFKIEVSIGYRYKQNFAIKSNYSTKKCKCNHSIGKTITNFCNKGFTNRKV